MQKEELSEDQFEETNIQDFHSPYTEEDFNNAIELNDEWQDDDLLCASGGANNKNEGLKFGIPAKPDSLQFADKSLTKRKISVQLSPDEDMSHTLDSEVLSIDGLPTPDELTTPDDMESSPSDSPRRLVGVDLEWDNDTPIFSDNAVSEKQAASEQMGAVDAEIYRTVIIGDEEYKMDLTAIIPYKQVLSHGGYYGEGLNAIVVFSACYLPDCNQTDYDYIMDNLFLYVVSTLDLLVAEEYMIVFFNSGCKRRNVPRFAWLKRCYKMIHRRLRKSLKQLLLVHPSWYMRALITFFRPFISAKFSRKLKLVSSLKELSNIVSLAGLSIPDAVNAHDAKRYSSARRVVVKNSQTKNEQDNDNKEGEVPENLNGSKVTH